MIENGSDGFFPIVVGSETSERACSTLSGPVEGNHVEAGRGDALPDREELLDQGIEPAMDDHRAPGRSTDGDEPVRGQRDAGVGDIVAYRAAAREGGIEELSVPAIARRPSPPTTAA